MQISLILILTLLSGFCIINISGSTFSCALISDSRIVTGNIGDSRCVLCSKQFAKESCRPLTIDHKPSDRNELMRIGSCGGRVAKLVTNTGQEYGPYRVWLKSKNIPGLAISRSFGDSIASTVGVYSVPDIDEYKILRKDKRLIIGSDGVWDKLSNEEVMEVALKCQSTNKAVEEITELATKRWREGGERIDDISCIVVKLNKRL